MHLFIAILLAHAVLNRLWIRSWLYLFFLLGLQLFSLVSRELFLQAQGIESKIALFYQIPPERGLELIIGHLQRYTGMERHRRGKKSRGMRADMRGGACGNNCKEIRADIVCFKSVLDILVSLTIPANLDPMKLAHLYRRIDGFTWRRTCSTKSHTGWGRGWRNTTRERGRRWDTWRVKTKTMRTQKMERAG